MFLNRSEYMVPSLNSTKKRRVAIFWQRQTKWLLIIFSVKSFDSLLYNFSSYHHVWNTKIYQNLADFFKSAFEDQKYNWLITFIWLANKNLIAVIFVILREIVKLILKTGCSVLEPLSRSSEIQHFSLGFLCSLTKNSHQN